MIAVVFGSIGMVLALGIAAILLAIFMNTADAVDAVVERIDQPIATLDARLDEADAAVNSGEVAEVLARADGLADMAASAQVGLEAVTDDPLYAALPIDTDLIEAEINALAARTTSIQAEAAGGVLDPQTVGEIQRGIADANTLLATVEAEVDTVADQILFWLRVVTLAAVLLALWALWGQFHLARYGLQRMRGHQ